MRPLPRPPHKEGLQPGRGHPGRGRATLCPQTAWGSSDVETAEWPGQPEAAAQGRLQGAEHRRQAAPENVPAVPGGDPVSRLPALPARPATRQHLQPCSHLRQQQSPPTRRGQPICDRPGPGVLEVHTQREGPKALGEDVPEKADGSSPGAGRAGAGVGMVQGQGGRRCSRTDG